MGQKHKVRQRHDKEDDAQPHVRSDHAPERDGRDERQEKELQLARAHHRRGAGVALTGEPHEEGGAPGDRDAERDEAQRKKDVVVRAQHQNGSETLRQERSGCSREQDLQWIRFPSFAQPANGIFRYLFHSFCTLQRDA